MIAVDTNVVVRYLIATDDARQSEKARSLIDSSEILVPVTVVLETEWVLRGVYRIARSIVANSLRQFANLPNVEIEHRDRFDQALAWFDAGLDFADALHLAGARNAEAFATFDRALIGADVKGPTVRPV